jgi:hypothetical protein
MSKILIGICGKARNGKDSVADHLVKGYNFSKASFAIPVKNFAVRHFDLHPEECYGEKTKKSRWVLQAIGNGCREEFGKNIWIDKLFNTFGAVEKVVIADVRYLNEAEALKARGGYIIKVTRPDAPEIECGADHPSEMEMEKIVPDFALDNDGDLHQLRYRADGILSLIKDRREG